MIKCVFCGMEIDVPKNRQKYCSTKCTLQAEGERMIIIGIVFSGLNLALEVYEFSLSIVNLLGVFIGLGITVFVFLVFY